MIVIDIKEENLVAKSRQICQILYLVLLYIFAFSDILSSLRFVRWWYWLIWNFNRPLKDKFFYAYRDIIFRRTSFLSSMFRPPIIYGFLFNFSAYIFFRRTNFSAVSPILGTLFHQELCSIRYFIFENSLGLWHWIFLKQDSE